MRFYDWRMDQIAGGHGYHVDVGAFSTSIRGGGAGDVIDQDQPEFVCGVPAGTTIFPIRIKVSCETPLIAADDNECEILIAVNDDAVPTDYGTATAETPVNMHTGSGNTSGCTVKSATTANMTNPTLSMELDRAVQTADVQGTAANALWNRLELLYEPNCPPMITGPATLLIYWGGTAQTDGYAQVEWIEIADR